MADSDAERPRLVRHRATLSRRTLDGVLVLAPGGDSPMLISAPGDVAWQLLAEPVTLDDLVATLASRFGSNEQVIRADIEPVLDALLDAGAIHRDEPIDT